jgi:hypothetical protein
VSLDVGLDEPADEEHLRSRLARKLSVPPEGVPAFVLRKRSIDARRGSVRFHLTFSFDATQAETDLGAPHPTPVDDPSRVLIVGDGPAGLFCSYELARRGIGSTVLDRGKPVQPRRRDLKGLNQRGEVDSDSNYCFGEGGAGTYSDGKLYTRSHKRGNVRDAGASALVLTLAGAGIPGILIPGVLYMFGVGLTFANALARTMSRFPNAMGAASAVFGVNQFLVGGLVAAGLSSLSEPSPLPLVVTTALAGCTCAALWWGWLRHLPE